MSTTDPLEVARLALAMQLFRYQDKHGVPDWVSIALRDTLTPTGPAGLPEHAALADAVDRFLRFDGGDYGLRRAFDAFKAALAAPGGET